MFYVPNKCPDAIQSVKLRKYVATVSQILNLEENELDWLARHLGHDIRVHREYYRLQESTLELAKVSKLLMAVDEGKAGNFAGKSLSEIDLKGKYLRHESRSFALCSGGSSCGSAF